MKITLPQLVIESSQEGNLSKIRIQESYDGNLTLSVDDAQGKNVFAVGGNNAFFYKGQDVIKLNPGFEIVATPTPVGENEVPANEYILEQNKWQVVTTPDGITRLWVNDNGTLKSITF